MNRNFVSARLAWRYIKSPKSHGAVSAVAAVSVAGVAVATAAIICVLSVFNGFRVLMAENLDTLAPDIVVMPAKGKVIPEADSLAARLAELEGVELAVPALVDNALIIADGREMPVTLRGVDFSRYPKLTGIDSITTGGTQLGSLASDETVASVGVAAKMGIEYSGTPLLVLSPRREGRVNMANPMASFIADSLRVTDVFHTQEREYDENLLICDIGFARQMFQRDREASVIEIKVAPGVNAGRLLERVVEVAGPETAVKDRYQLQEINYRMVSIEKWVTFLLLAFILVIASFNIISTLCMLVIEKQNSFGTLSALGMTRRQIGSTFAWESIMVTIVGGLAGIVLGVVACLLQEKFGLIRLAGDPEALTLTAYPVRLEWGDVLATLIPLFVIGGVTAWIASLFARRRVC